MFLCLLHNMCVKVKVWSHVLVSLTLCVKVLVSHVLVSL